MRQLQAVIRHAIAVLITLAILAATPFVALALLLVVIVVTLIAMAAVSRVVDLIAMAAVSRVVEWMLGPTLVNYGPRVLSEAAWRLAVAAVVIAPAWWLWDAVLGWRVRTVWGAVSGRQPGLAKALRTPDGRRWLMRTLAKSKTKVRAEALAARAARKPQATAGEAP